MTAAKSFIKPNRLSKRTHELANRYLNGEFCETLASANVSLDECIDTTGMSENMKHAAAVMEIAKRAPVRIIPSEKLIGSATLIEATKHMAPILNTPSVSHTTLGYRSVLDGGYRNLRKRINNRLNDGKLDAEGADLLKSMLICIDAATLWHSRYISLLQELINESEDEAKYEYQEILKYAKNVPENPPTSFREAIQSFWLQYCFIRLCGNWPGLGRIDEMLGPYLKHDLANGIITLDDARELMAHFWIRGSEWFGLNAWGGGDAQFYQNIILGGIDKEGNEAANEVTYLVLDVVEELHISDFPIAVRINRNSPERLLRKIAETQQQGGGIVSVYNEEVIIEALCKFGYPIEEARQYTNDGCWEPLIPGHTCFSYYPFDLLFVLQNTLGLNDISKPLPNYADFESLYSTFKADMAKQVDDVNIEIDGMSQNPLAAPLISMYFEECIENGRGYYQGGPKYRVVSPHAGGMPDTANSLFAIKKMVFDEKLIKLSDYLNILRNNWNNNEDLRKYVLHKLEYYGNDNDESDSILMRVFNDFIECVEKVHERSGTLRPAGISTFGREIEWRNQRCATASGNIIGDILATNFSPTPGSDTKGPTAVLRSFCKIDYSRLPGCATLELKILPDSISGESGIMVIMSLLRTFVQLGGSYFNIDVIDTNTLKDAQIHPERYRNLAVRISGWCARFTTLEKEWQDMVINRTQQIIK